MSETNKLLNTRGFLIELLFIILIVATILFVISTPVVMKHYLWELLISVYTLEALDNARREISSLNMFKFMDEVGRVKELLSSFGLDPSTSLEDIIDFLS